jgi:ribose 5-phosphate isomerase B
MFFAVTMGFTGLNAPEAGDELGTFLAPTSLLDAIWLQFMLAIAADLRDRGFAVHDCGTDSTDPVDYPDIAHAVAEQVARGQCQAGIVVDGAGIGSAIAANKVPGVRAATCWDVSSAKNSREHNHANVLALGAGLLGEQLALQVVAAWVATAWGGERHARRVAKIALLDQRYARGLA